jgi:protein SCO1/2
LESAIRWILLSMIALMGLLALSAIGAVLLSEREPLLPRYSTVPEFELTNQAGKTVTDQDLRGRVWVADFIFTDCPSICPMLTHNMSNLQTWLQEEQDQPDGDRVRLVSFSVDPEHDTPSVLRQFGQRYEADFDQWHFLTGESNERMWQLSEEGFKLTAEANDPDQAMKIAHTDKMVLVDATGRIRGYYEGTKPESLDKLRKDIAQLLGKTPPIDERQNADDAQRGAATQPATAPIS